MSQYIKEICKIGQGKLCCKYLGADHTGMVCFKANAEMRATIDKQWALHEHVAQGDNCAGINPIPETMPELFRKEDSHISEDGHYPGLPFHP